MEVALVVLVVVALVLAGPLLRNHRRDEGRPYRELATGNVDTDLIAVGGREEAARWARCERSGRQNQLSSVWPTRRSND